MSRRRWVALAAALGVGAAAALGAPGAGQAAVAGLQDDRIVVGPMEEIPARVDAIARTGARVVRVDLFWSDVAPVRPARPRDPADPAYRFERWDRILTGLAARGIRPLVSVYSAPAWATGGRVSPEGRHNNPFIPAARDYAAFLHAAARRYSGGFSAAGVRMPRVAMWEIWNEPNMPGYLRPQARRAALSAYVRMARAAYPAIKAANRRSTVIVGAAGPSSSTRASVTSARDWMEGILRARVPMDAYSQHVYPAAAPRARVGAVPSWSNLDVLLSRLKRSRPRTPLLVTEAGYTTAATPFRRTKVTPAQQGAYLRQIFALPMVRRHIPLVVWFQLEDNAHWPGGLLREGGAPKPSHAAFRALARRGSVPAILRR